MSRFTIPANDEVPYNAIYFARGFYSSALHEIAHWLVAGKERRKLEDFGYWYEPDGVQKIVSVILKRLK